MATNNLGECAREQQRYHRAERDAAAALERRNTVLAAAHRSGASLRDIASITGLSHTAIARAIATVAHVGV
jgi:lambda repressor-like predicted transcriptional regulator